MGVASTSIQRAFSAPHLLVAQKPVLLDRVLRSDRGLSSSLGRLRPGADLGVLLLLGGLDAVQAVPLVQALLADEEAGERGDDL